MNRLIALLLCTVLACQGALSAVVQNQQLQALTAKAPEDLELICSGTSMQWISVEQTLELGSLVFVEGPDDFSAGLLKRACPEQTVFEQQSSMGLTTNSLLALFSKQQTFESTLPQAPNTHLPYSKALSRAPPAPFS